MAADGPSPAAPDTDHLSASVPTDPTERAMSGISALIDAGNDAFLRGEFPVALARFDQAAEAAAHHPETLDLRTRALVNRASTADRMGDHPAAVASFREALGLCERLAGTVAAEDPVIAAAVTAMRASALVNLSQALLNTGDLSAALYTLEQARELLDPKDEILPEDTADLFIATLVALTALTIQREEWSRAHELAVESLDVVLRHRPALTGRPLMNLSAVHLATGRPDLGEDFAHQAIAAFEASDTPSGVAETRQSLAQLCLRSGRIAEAQPLLAASQEFFDRAGMDRQSAFGLDLLGLSAALRGDQARAVELYGRSLARFEACGAPIGAAEVRVRLAAGLHARRRYDESEAQLDRAQEAFMASGLGLRRAQTDFFHATLLADRVPGTVPGAAVGPAGAALLGRAVGLAVPAALALDAVRFTLAGGAQRERWRRALAEPAMRLAFRLAVRAGAADLVAELIESRCAGTPLRAGPPDDAGIPGAPGASEAAGTTGAPGAGPPGLQPPDFLHPLTFPGRMNAASPHPEEPGDAFQLGAALAGVAAEAGLPVDPPPRLALTRTGTVALAAYLAQAEARYGARIRTARVVPTW
ncbi:hypothetical protein ACIQ7D_22505 [Streptomyces sp. NPDC096310]|uniref:hypothetical protein n=1 Tax=Streptomyces sp. NPDC096310 TaxID=3366082 RepID=UPI00380F8951